jgi:hypothetical protein
VGPDLVEDLVPGYKLIATVGKAVAEKVGWMAELDRLIQRKQERFGADGSLNTLERGRIFEQYTNVLKALASEQPLLLVIDDLHWADPGSIALLFHLARRIQQSRILLVGTFRSNEIALGRNGERHPLDTVFNELQRYYGNIEINLEQVDERAGREVGSLYSPLNSCARYRNEKGWCATMRATGWREQPSTGTSYRLVSRGCSKSAWGVWRRRYRSS